MEIGQGTTFDQAIAAGWHAVSGEELQQIVAGNTVWGDYPGGFRFVSYCDIDGTCMGTNNVGSDNAGNWKIDKDAGTLTMSWDRGWLPTTTRAVLRDGVVHFFDHDTGNWRTSFTRIESGRHPLVV